MANKNIAAPPLLKIFVVDLKTYEFVVGKLMNLLYGWLLMN